MHKKTSRNHAHFLYLIIHYSPGSAYTFSRLTYTFSRLAYTFSRLAYTFSGSAYTLIWCTLLQHHQRRHISSHASRIQTRQKQLSEPFLRTNCAIWGQRMEYSLPGVLTLSHEERHPYQQFVIREDKNIQRPLCRQDGIHI